MAPFRRSLPLWLGATVGLSCWLVLALCFLGGAFTAPDLRLTDTRFWLRGERRADDRIAIVEIDDATVRAYPNWPLPRRDYAVLLQALEESGASAIGFDLQFAGRDRVDGLGDLLLAKVSSWSPHVVHAMSFAMQPPGMDGVVASGRDSVEALLARHGVPANGLPFESFDLALLPAESLAVMTPALAHVTVLVDPDGGVRRIPIFAQYGNTAIPTLALRLAVIAGGSKEPPQVEAAPGGVRVHWGSDTPRLIPVDGSGATQIDFAGTRGAFVHRYSMLHMLHWYGDSLIDSLRAAFAGRIVLIGTTAVSEVTTDLGPSPFAENAPLVYVHANALDSILRGRFLRAVPVPVYLGAFALIAVLLGLVFATLAVPVGALVALGTMLALFGVNLVLFAWGGVDVPPTLSLLLAPLGYTAIAIYRYVFLERHDRWRDQELEVARKIQQHLLPLTPPQMPLLDVHGFNVPAQEVGGDYFDWIKLEDGSLLLALGDVSGKGVAASLLMSHLRASLHSEARAGRPPVEIVSAMNQSLSRAVFPGKFATFFLACVAADGASFTYCNAGHNWPFLMRGDSLEKLPANGLPLGMIAETTYAQCGHTFEPGDVLIMYSDGVPESPGKQPDYGEERLEALARRLTLRRLSAKQVGQAIFEDVRSFCHGQLGYDDITIVVARRVEPRPVGETQYATSNGRLH